MNLRNLLIKDKEIEDHDKVIISKKYFTYKDRKLSKFSIFFFSR